MFALRRRPTHLTRGAIAKSSPFANHRCFTAAVATQAPASSYNTLLRKPIEGSKSVVVTGSARGIGKSIALRLALDGYNVCINDIGANEKACEEVVKEIQSIGRKACTATADVSKAGEVRDMIQKSVRQLGPLHTMVANAGIIQVKSLLDLTEEDFDRVIAVNLKGVHNCYREAARQMIAQGTCKPDAPGKLVGAASMAAFKPSPMLGHYSASKWAVRGLTRTYAAEMAEHHITVNAYAPGVIDTTMWDPIDAQMVAAKVATEGVEETSVKKGDMTKEYAKQSSLLRRMGASEDVAKLVSFLASSDSDYITGQTQVVDGGIVFT